jgi:uncharacterized repeat protein (TIGR01451 family)
LAAAVLSALVFPMAGQTAVTLTVTPITWNIIGLDSNKPASGPRFFPVGARVCSSVATTGVTVTLVWDSPNANVNVRPGSLNPLTIASIPAGGCADAYFEVEVTQVAAAYDTARRYHITATDGSGTASTVTPRELYVEHLISQNRNGITDVKVKEFGQPTFVSIPSGGSMNLVVGQTYVIELDGFTATQGYNQLESFINFPNTIFQIVAVSTTYSADDNTTAVPNPNDRLYADACTWDNDPTSPNYRSCVGGDFKAGGTVSVTYTVKIVGGGGTSQTLNTLFYDFSGSSFHYNSDFSSSARIVNVLDPTALTFAKAFTPATTTANGVSTLTFTIGNPTAAPIGGLTFTDTLPTSPGAMVVAPAPNATTSGCGTPTWAPVPGSGSLSFANGTVAANSTCTASVSVTVPAIGTYINTSGNLFVDSLDTGHNATAPLTANAAGAPGSLCGLTMAQWSVPNGTTANPPDLTGGLPTVKAADVATATLSANVAGDAAIATTLGHGDTTSWNTWGYKNAGQFIQFVVDTTNYSQVSMSFWVDNPTPANGPTQLVVSYSTGGPFTTALTINSPAAAFTLHTIDFTGLTNTGGTTTFRISGSGANNDNNNGGVNYDDIVFTGCGAVQRPTLAKAFSPNPIALNAVSTLTFTLVNPNSAPLTGVKFSDTLPAGLEVAQPPSAGTTCANSPSWAPAAGDTTLDFDGATIPASSSCSATVNVRATTSGPHANVSGFISSTESGTNSGAGGSASSSLTALQPPSIAKVFSPDPILTGGVTTLTFLLTNPNPNDGLSGVAFSDTFPLTPGAMVVASPTNAATVNCGVPTFNPTAGDGSVSFAGGTIAAGATCTVRVDVTAPAAGDYANTSGAVSATIASVIVTGNTASDSVAARDANPALSLLKRVSTATAGPWTPFVSVAPGTSIYYRFVVENVGDVPLSPLSVTDPLVNAAGCPWPATLPVASPSADPTASCVVGPVATLAGDHPNTATAHGGNGGTTTDSLPSSADYIGAVPGFSLLKQIGTSPSGPWSSSITVAPSTAVYFKFTLVNTGNVALGQVSVTDPDVSTATCTFTDPLAVNGATTCVVGPVTASAVLGPHPNTAVGHGTDGRTTVDTAPSSATYTVATTTPDLAIGKTHTGNFTQGQTGTYTIAVSNVGLAATSGTVSVTDTLPTGLAPTSATSSDFSCGIASQTVTCTTTSVLAPNASYAPITVTVDVLATAASSVVNTAVVSGGGDTNPANNSASDPTTVTPAAAGPDLTIQKVHSGSFVQGQTGAYTLTVKNVGGTAASGTVTVTETPPTGLTIATMAGTNWSCTAPMCTRSDALAPNGSYEPITVTVNVSATAGPSVTNVATVSGGGDTNPANNSASDPTTVSPAAAGPDLAIQKVHSGSFVQGQTGAYTLTVKNVGGTAASGTVTVTETPPTGLTIATMAGTNWSCTAPTCTRSDALAPNGSYEPITVTVNVSATAGPSVTNVATVSGGGDTSPANNSASDPTQVDPPADPPVPIPMLNVWMLGLLTVLLAVIAAARATRRQVKGPGPR